MQGVVPTGERPGLLGSPGLGRCHMGNSAVLLRDCAVHPGDSACLPVRITCLGMPGLRDPKPCRAPDCLGKYSTLCLRSAVFWGRLGTAYLGDLTLCWGKSAICWGSLGTACLGEIALGRNAVFWGGLGTACKNHLLQLLQQNEKST